MKSENVMKKYDEKIDLFGINQSFKEIMKPILPKVKGDLNNDATFEVALKVKSDASKSKLDLKKQLKAHIKTIKKLESLLESKMIKNRKILNYDESQKILMTEHLVPFQEIYDFKGNLIARSNYIEMGLFGFYFYDFDNEEFVAMGYKEDSKKFEVSIRRKTENDLLLEFERLDKGRRLGFKKVPAIPKDFKYST